MCDASLCHKRAMHFPIGPPGSFCRVAKVAATLTQAVTTQRESHRRPLQRGPAGHQTGADPNPARRIVNHLN